MEYTGTWTSSSKHLLKRIKCPDWILEPIRHKIPGRQKNREVKKTPIENHNTKIHRLGEVSGHGLTS